MSYICNDLKIIDWYKNKIVNECGVNDSSDPNY